MKKRILILTLAMVFLTTGCAKEDGNASQGISTEDTKSENTETEKNDLESDMLTSKWEEYMISVKEQSDAIRNSLETDDTLSQADMNVKSEELYELWDKALNDLWSALKANLSEEEFAKLLTQQRAWIAEKEEKIKEAGKEVEGGSLYPTVIYGEGAKLTEARIYELYEILKKIN